MTLPIDEDELAVARATSVHSETRLFHHVTRPEWGAALWVEESHDRRVFLYADQRRTVARSHWDRVAPIDGGPLPPPPSYPGSDDLALTDQRRVLADPVDVGLYHRWIADPPKRAHPLADEVLRRARVGEHGLATLGLSSALGHLESLRPEDPSELARTFEYLAILRWLTGDREAGRRSFGDAADATAGYLSSKPSRAAAGIVDLLLRRIAAGDPQRGLEESDRLFALPDTDPSEYREVAYDQLVGRQHRAAKALAKGLVAGQPARDIEREVASHLQRERARDSIAGWPVPWIWQLIAATVVRGIEEPRRAMAHVYELLPELQRPLPIQAILAA